jgi:DNA processing protein
MSGPAPTAQEQAEACDHGVLPREAWVTAVMSLEGMGPARFRALLDHFGDAHVIWDRLANGKVHQVPEVAATMGEVPGRVAAVWSAAALRLDPVDVWQRHVDAGVGVLLAGGPAYPGAFAEDPEPPPILFHQGDPDVLVGPRVGIVGTRDCTRYGHELAFELAGDLAGAGVSIVSGLALGIDSAAHAGAVDVDGAPPIAVVGSGLDVIYPRRNGPLWREVARRGVVWSEYPLGTAATAWHFPARNRLIAALSDVVVVVESHARGGALSTVEEALARGRTVMAVPGPVRSPASAGTNQLLADGPAATVARDATDVLVALGMAPGSRRKAAERRVPPAPVDQSVLEAIGWQPATTDHLLVRTGLSFPDLAGALSRLEDTGWVAQRGGWFERRAKPGV